MFLGHPAGLFLLFMVEMWERFSYYGMRGLLVLYLTSPTTGMRVPPPGAAPGFNPGRGWTDEAASTAYGWYTGLCYLAPILGGMLADKLIGTHRSMVVGGLLIALGHIMLGVSGLGTLDQSAQGMSLFVFGLALVIVGTGHFKPCVSVMVGQLYEQGDPRRESAFGIFYMGINLGAALQTYIVGTLGELFGWHWGFGAAAVGMLCGLGLYTMARPWFLEGVGLPPAGRGGGAPLFVPLGISIAAVAAVAFHNGILGRIDQLLSNPIVSGLLALASVIWAAYFISRQAPDDRGPVASIFIFMLFNAVFWLSFEQAGSSINLFTDRDTDRLVTLPQWLVRLGTEAGYPVSWGWWAAAGALLGVLSIRLLVHGVRRQRNGSQLAGLFGALGGLALVALGACKSAGLLAWVGGFQQVPTTWFQSINPWLIICFAPITGFLWTALARRNADPSQPVKIGMGLLGVGLGYLFLVWGAMKVGGGVKAGMFVVFATYFLHTMGEIILSPTGLSYVTKAAPKNAVSLLMGIWFISSFIANLGAGKVAAGADWIRTRVPWNFGGQADFFFLFVVTSCAAGLVILAFSPLLRRLMRPGT
jgi:POT family proton-dependent oligopeptide transporter